MPDNTLILIGLTAAITLLLAIGGYRAWALGKSKEPAILGSLTMAAFEAENRAIAEMQAEAQALAEKASTAAAQFAQVRAKVAGVANPPA